MLSAATSQDVSVAQPARLSTSHASVRVAYSPRPLACFTPRLFLKMNFVRLWWRCAFRSCHTAPLLISPCLCLTSLFLFSSHVAVVWFSPNSLGPQALTSLCFVPHDLRPRAYPKLLHCRSKTQSYCHESRIPLLRLGCVAILKLLHSPSLTQLVCCTFALVHRRPCPSNFESL